MDTNIVAYHVVEGVVDRLDDLCVPVFVFLFPVVDVVDVDRPVELDGSHPLEEHGVGVLTGEIGNDGWPGRPDVGANHQRLRRLALVLGRVSFDPYLVLRIWFCNNAKREMENPNNLISTMESE